MGLGLQRERVGSWTAWITRPHVHRLLGLSPATFPPPHRQAGVTETRRVGGVRCPGHPPPHRESTWRISKHPFFRLRVATSPSCATAPTGRVRQPWRRPSRGARRRSLSRTVAVRPSRPARARPPGGSSRRGLQVARDRPEFRGGPGAVVRDHPRGFPRSGEHHVGGGRAARGEFRGPAHAPRRPCFEKNDKVFSASGPCQRCGRLRAPG